MGDSSSLLLVVTAVLLGAAGVLAFLFGRRRGHGPPAKVEVRQALAAPHPDSTDVEDEDESGSDRGDVDVHRGGSRTGAGGPTRRAAGRGVAEGQMGLRAARRQRHRPAARHDAGSDRDGGDDGDDSGEEPRGSARAPLARLQRRKEQKERERVERQQAQEAAEEARRAKREAEQLRRVDKEEEEARLAALEEEALQELRREKQKREDEEYKQWIGEIGVEERGEVGVVDSLQERLREYLVGRARALDERRAQGSPTAAELTRVLVLQDIAREFDVTVEKLVAVIEALCAEDAICGVLDDRGKFLFLSQEQLLQITRFIRNRGRVSTAELVRECGRIVAD